jgi:hypothetical protein
MVGFAHERRSRRAAQVEREIKALLCDRAFAEFSWPVLARGQHPGSLDARPE